MRTLSHAVFTAFLWLALSAGTPARADQVPTFDVVAKEGRLEPARLEVPAGQRIKFVIRNQGKTPIEFENAAMRIEKVLAPGASSFVILPKLKPGEYTFVDEFHEDTAKMTVIAK
jgi:plastocyanin